jgi:hypothetical protein
MGRPSIYSEKLANAICDELTEGRSLRQICASEGFPNRQSVLNWLAANEGFSAKYARAREQQADLMDDKIIEAAEACDEDNYQSTKVKIGAYQWRASKLAPKKYGDKVENIHNGSVGVQLIHQIPRPERESQ